MDQSSLAYICRGQQRYLQSLNEEYERWQRDHAEAMAARDVEDWIGESLKAHFMIRGGFERVLTRLRENNPWIGEVLPLTDQLLALACRLFAAVEAGIKALESRGYAVDRTAEFRHARMQLEHMKTKLEGHWKIDEAAWRKTGEDIRAGRFQTTEDILHELQGGGAP